MKNSVAVKHFGFLAFGMPFLLIFGMLMFTTATATAYSANPSFCGDYVVELHPTFYDNHPSFVFPTQLTFQVEGLHNFKYASDRFFNITVLEKNENLGIEYNRIEVLGEGRLLVRATTYRRLRTKPKLGYRFSFVVDLKKNTIDFFSKGEISLGAFGIKVKSLNKSRTSTCQNEKELPVVGEVHEVQVHDTQFCILNPSVFDRVNDQSPIFSELDNKAKLICHPYAVQSLQVPTMKVTTDSIPSEEFRPWMGCQDSTSLSVSSSYQCVIL